MAEPDDATSRTPSGEPQPSSGQPPKGSDAGVPPRQRIADRWNQLGPVGRTALLVIGGVAVAVVRGLLASPDARSTAEARGDEADTDATAGQWTNHAGGYWVCSHDGCTKKVDPTIFGHHCCGKCWPGRECGNAARRDYDGPGSFAHSYQVTLLFPGTCGVCDEPPEAHRWVFDSIHGERRPAL